MARLRRALKGNAREAIKSLLYSEASPLEVMQALRRRYGRPDALVLAELDRIKTLPKISENPKDICVFASQINNSVAAIKGLKKPQYLHSPEMVKQIIEKMPTILKFRWYDFTAAADEGEFSDLTLVSRFLNTEADKCGAFATTEERIWTKRTHRQATHSTKEREGNFEEARASEKTCPVCQGEHFLRDCQKFLKASVQDRWALVKKSRVCFRCLQGRHRKENCRKPPCKECKRWHHHLLHAGPEERTTAGNEDTQRGASSIMASVNAVNNARAYLKIVPVEVFGSHGSKKILALMDEGSTVSLLDEKVAQEIGVQGTTEELVIETVGGQLIKKKDSQTLDLTVKGIHQGRRKTLNRVRTVDNLKLAPQFLEKKRIEDCPHLKKIADSLHYEGESPQLLIGQDNWELIVTREVRRGRPGQPVASRTGLGWVLHGLDTGGIRPVHFANRCLHASEVEEEMHRTIKEHFAIEALGVQARRPTTDAEGKALAILEKTCRRLEDGRFEAGLLWRKEDEVMPDNYASARTRLFNIEKKLDKDPQLKSEYSKQIQHLIDNQYAEEAPVKDGENKKTWYLPHFSVVHPLKKKIRIVFDAAAKCQGRSLNDALLPGPDLLQSLFGPEFLRKEEVDWPTPRTFKKETTGEEKTVDVVATASTRHPSPDPERFSSWKRLWRATARVLQFIQLCRKKEKVHAAKNDPAWKMTTSKKTKTDGKVIRPSNVQDRRYIPLDAELLEQAEALLLKGSQERCFREDIKCVQQEKQPEGSSKLRKLDVVYEDGLLRLKGRIDAIQEEDCAVLGA
ncbi:hypothetical protein PYW07_010705 [Mythimna separata]|uniref:CCHC-type domain-containing protein n=1 Tax=Mythimna separata TaxID=271217 RepID=A0AAD7Y872_MYTSE|nr:hypothetical protein PYW07_010705 [Mythimna separata]